MTTVGFLTDSTLCIGCKACEVACKEWNGLSSDGFDWSGLSYDNTYSLGAQTWRHVKFVEGTPEAGKGGNHSDGSPYGPKVRLNQYTANDQTNVQVAAGPNGTFVAVWQSTGQDNGDDGIYGRVFTVPPNAK